MLRYDQERLTQRKIELSIFSKDGRKGSVSKIDTISLIIRERDLCGRTVAELLAKIGDGQTDNLAAPSIKLQSVDLNASDKR